MKIRNRISPKRRRNIRSNNFRHRKFILETLEDRRVLAGAFLEIGSNLSVDVDTPGEQVSVVSRGTHYELSLSNGAWTGADSANVTGNGTNTLTVTNQGLSTFEKIDVTDSASEVSVVFADSGALTYSDSFDVTLDQPNAGSVSFTGSSALVDTASLRVNTTGQVVLASATSQLSAENGNISLTANQDQALSSFTGPGLIVDGGSISVTGSGSLDIYGRGGGNLGHTDGLMSGVYVVNGGRISGGTTLTTSITGVGGISSGTNNQGVWINGISADETRRSRISSLGGDVIVNGTGGGVGSGGFNRGVAVWHGGELSAGGLGEVQVTGVGGNSDGPFNLGVSVSSNIAGRLGEITSSGGNVTVVGTGKGTELSSWNRGVEVIYGGLITAGGDGTVSIEGTAGRGTGDGNVGVYVFGSNQDNTLRSTITTNSGQLTITGTGGGEGISRYNHGVEIKEGGMIQQNGVGFVVVSGTGGATTGHTNHGVVVHDETAGGVPSTITSSGGDVTIVGVGGGSDSATSGGNIGVRVATGGEISTAGLGNLSIDGTGGLGQGNYNRGVGVNGSSTSGSRSRVITESGNVTIVGVGGGTGASNNNDGVAVVNGGLIQPGSTGSLSIHGTGGASSGSSSDGVDVWGLDDEATITSSGGDVTIVGLGGGSDSATSGGNIGVWVVTGGEISTTGLGNLSIDGTGGLGQGDFNRGVAVGRSSTSGKRSSVVTESGNVTIVGVGGGTGASNNNDGVAVVNGGLIQPGSTGSLSIHGTGGASSGSSSDGVDVWGLDDEATITSSGGDVTIVGLGGGSDSATSGGNIGVWVVTGGEISTTGLGNLSIDGTGGLGQGDFNRGVLVDGSSTSGKRSSVVTETGNVTIVGVGGGTGASNNNDGVAVVNGGLIQPGSTGSLSIHGTGGASSGSDNDGVEVNGEDAAATITSSGGSISIEGTGGGTGDSSLNAGVLVIGGGEILGASSASLTVTGVGGLGSGENNQGVWINGISADETRRSRISSLGGDVIVNGTGGGVGSGGFNRGVAVWHGGELSAGGLGEVQVTGVGGNSDGPFNLGVSVSSNIAGRLGEITSSGGNVTVVGTGKGTELSSWNRGVEVIYGGLITAGGDGTVSIEGTAGRGTGDGNVGVYVFGSNQDNTLRSTITTNSGQLTITGTGGGEGISRYNHGVEIKEGGMIQQNGVGFVVVSGTGGATTGHTNHGVVVHDETAGGVPSTITSSGGDVTIVGVGGGSDSATSGGNIGVRVATGGEISSGIQGQLSVTGTGGVGTGGGNQGVVVSGISLTAQRSKISSQAGSIHVSGVGGGQEGSAYGSNDGVAITAGGVVEGLGSTNVHISGVGGPTLGDFNHGIVVNGLESSSSISVENGDLSIEAMGGGGEGGETRYSRGLSLYRGGQVFATGGGNITVRGEAGLGDVGYNQGIFVGGINSADDRSSIHSAGGNIDVTGEGGGSADSIWNFGIFVASHGRIETTGNGKLTVSGISGRASGENQVGVAINASSSPAYISTENGNLSVYGRSLGNGASNTSEGVELTGGGEISSKGTGAINVIGIGGGGGGSGNHGVMVHGVSNEGQPSQITSELSEILLSGVGGGQANSTSSANNGVLVIAGGRIEGKKLSNVVVEGKGGKTQGNGNHGILVNSLDAFSSISVEHGSLVVNGFGGGEADAMSSYNRGVAVVQGGRIEALGSGDITIEGTGGLGGGNFHDGVFAAGKSNDGVGAMIAATSGNLSIIGLGGGSGSSNLNSGVNVENGGLIQSGQEGDLAIRGTGGRTEGEYNIGVRVNGSNSEAAITSLGGHAQIDGIGGGSASSVDSLGNYGVNAQAGGVISVLGTGSLAINGTGGVGAGNANKGIQVAGLSLSSIRSAITAMSGTMSLVGTGGGSVGASFNHGVEASNGGMIQSATGTITLNGIGGGQSASGFNQGVLISGGASVESTSNANLFVTGQGGLASGFQNHGVHITGHTENQRARLFTSGHIEVTGFGGGVAGSRYNDGVRLWDEGLIETTGSGQIKVNGTGGGTEGIENNGVSVFDQGQILSEDGMITIQGVGGGDVSKASSLNRGIELRSGGQVKSSGTGSITIDGTGGSGTGGQHHGVALRLAGSDGSLPTIAAQTGSIQVTGNVGNGTGGQGIYLDAIGTFNAGNKLLLEGIGNADGYGLLATGASTHLSAVSDLKVKGSLRLNAIDADFGANPTNLRDAVWTANIDGSTPELQHDQMDVIGLVDLTGMQLKITGGHAFALGESLTLIDNDGTDSIQGQLRLEGSTNALPEGSLISFAGQTLELSYAGGDGNDLTVTAINLLPRLDTIGNLTIDEDAAEQTINLAGITAGGDESQPLRVTAVSSNQSLIANPTVSYQSPGESGEIFFTPLANQFGTSTITVTVEDGGNDGNLSTTADNGTVEETFVVSVTPVNDPPRFDSIDNLSFDEDSGDLTVGLSGITAGGDESQPLRVKAVSSNQSLFADPSVSYASADETGTLLFTPLPNQSGKSEVTVTVEDGGLDGNLETPADNAFYEKSFWVDVSPVNDPPVFDPVADLTLVDVIEDSGTPVGEAGTLVSTLIDENGPLSNFSDIDGVAPGIAVVGKNIAVEKIWFSTDDGQNWQEVGSVSDLEALVLFADASTRLYAQTVADFSGDLTDALTIKAWDQTGGYSNGQAGVDSTTNAFSSTTDTVSLSVEASPSSAVDDFYAPEFNSGETFDIAKADLIANDTLGNGESIDTVTITTESASAAGGAISVGGDVFTYTRPASWFSGIDTFSYTLDDGGSESTATVTILSGLVGDTLTITLEPGRDHEVTLQYSDDKLVMVDHVTQTTLLNIPRELVPVNVEVVGAPANANIVTFKELSGQTPGETNTSWSYQGGSTSDEIAVLGTGSQWAWLSSDPQVENDVTVELKLLTSLIDTYTMIAVEKVSVGQVDRVEVSDPYLDVADTVFDLASLQPFNLPSSTTINGGQIVSQTPVGLHTAESFVGLGIVSATFGGGITSSVRATGDLTIGNASDSDGFRTDGRIEVGPHRLTLLDANQARVGELTTLGDTDTAGTLLAANGLIVDFSGNIEGYGTVDTTNGDSTRLILNNGTISGRSPEQPMTLTATVKGVGSLNHVVMDGTFTPGFSPTRSVNGRIQYSERNTIQVELGGLKAGSQYDRIEHAQAILAGTLEVLLIDGFIPMPGDQFEVLQSELPFGGGFSEINFPVFENGVRLIEKLGSSSFDLGTVFEVKDTLEINKSELGSFEITGWDDSILKINSERFRAIVKPEHGFTAESIWSVQAVETEDDDWLQKVTDGIHTLEITGSKWKNFVRPSDINNSGDITALDALQVINELSRKQYSADLGGALQEPAEVGQWPGMFYDQNGDGNATALDALRVINDLARMNNGGSAEGELLSQLVPVSDGGSEELGESLEKDYRFEETLHDLARLASFQKLFSHTDFVHCAYETVESRVSGSPDQGSDRVMASVNDDLVAAVDKIMEDF